MSSGKNDWFDDLSDLNDDGKTTIDGEFAAFQIMNRCKKQEDDGMPCISPPKPKLLMLHLCLCRSAAPSRTQFDIEAKNGKIRSDKLLLRLKIRNICGDETVWTTE